jgi:hypothetical protein
MTRGIGLGLKLVFWIAVLSPAMAAAQSLKPYVDGEQLHLRSSNLRLLSGDAAKRLRNGATVTYAFRVETMATKGGVARAPFTYHCVFSWDIWNGTYKVSRLEPGYRSASNLNQNGAEQTCLDSLVVPVSVLPAGNFWISLAYQMEERASPNPADDSRSIPGVLVDIFSRRTADSKPVEVIQSGPFRVVDLRKAR